MTPQPSPENKPAKPTESGFGNVFNGKDFDGWLGSDESGNPADPSSIFKVEDGGLVATQEVGLIRLEHDYDEFKFEFEYIIPDMGRAAKAHSDGALAFAILVFPQGNEIIDQLWEARYNCLGMSLINTFIRRTDAIRQAKQHQNAEFQTQER